MPPDALPDVTAAEAFDPRVVALAAVLAESERPWWPPEIPLLWDGVTGSRAVMEMRRRDAAVAEAIDGAEAMIAELRARAEKAERALAELRALVESDTKPAKHQRHGA